MGILAPRKIITKVQAEAEATKAKRAAKNAVAREYRRKKEEEANEKHVETLRELLPGIPEADAKAIVNHAFTVGSGRVGRTSQLDVESKLIAATKAHIRHVYTEYDDLLVSLGDREMARDEVRDEVRKIFDSWDVDPDSD